MTDLEQAPDLVPTGLDEDDEHPLDTLVDAGVASDDASDEPPAVSQVMEGLALLVLVGSMAMYIPNDLSPWWLPRVVIAWIVAPIGVVLLVRRAIDGCRASLVGLAFLGWAALGAIMSGAPRISLVGAIGRPSSVLFVAWALGAYAIGRSLDRRARERLITMIVALGALSAVLAVVQLFEATRESGIGLNVGRPVGLAAFPVFFGAHMGACAVVFVHRLTERTKASDIAWLLFFATATALSGSRIASTALLVVIIAMVVRTRRPQVALGLPVWFVALWTAAHLHSWAGTERSVGDRLDGRGLGVRLDVWGFGLDGLRERPILGHGVGRFHAATVDYFSDDFVARWGGFSDFRYRDAHNVVVEYLVTTGIVGITLLLAFAFLAGRRATGPMAWMAGVVVVSWAFEAAGPMTAPLVGLLVGAATLERADVDTAAILARAKWPMVIAAGTGALVAASVVIGAAAIQDRPTEPVGPGLGVEAAYFRGDPVAADLMATWNLRLVETPDGEAADQTLAWLDEAIAAEPSIPFWRSGKMSRLLQFQRLDDAAAEARRVLDIQQNHAYSLMVLRAIEVDRGSNFVAAEYESRLCHLGAPWFCGDTRNGGITRFLYDGPQ